jgi:hypothetical protein
MQLDEQQFDHAIDRFTQNIYIISLQSNMFMNILVFLLTMSVALKSAPIGTYLFTGVTCPPEAAYKSGVMPFCNKTFPIKIN